MRYIGFMNKLHIAKVNRMSLRDQVYMVLKEAIVSLELAPEERIHDAKLADSFGVSRTPVREALKRLEDEGLIQSFPGSVTKVAPLREEDAIHAFVVVASLFGLAARLGCKHLSQEQIKRLESANERLLTALQQQDAAAALEEDTRFHSIFIEAAANPELQDALERILPKVRRISLAKFSSIAGFHSVEDHKEIISAAREGNAQQAGELTEQNWLTLGALLSGHKGDIE